MFAVEIAESSVYSGCPCSVTHIIITIIRVLVVVVVAVAVIVVNDTNAMIHVLTNTLSVSRIKFSVYD